MKFILTTLLIISVLRPFYCMAQANPEKKVPLDITSPSTFYADKEYTIPVKTVKELVKKIFKWNLRYAGRTVLASEQVIPESGIVKIKFKFPKLNPGIIAATYLTCYSDKYKVTKNLFFYPENPFTFVSATLKDQKVGIWEPGDKKSLSNLMKSLHVPYFMVNNFDGFDGTILLITGIDFEEFPNLAEILLKLSLKGVRIIIMPPCSGTLILPINSPNQVLTAKNCFIKDISKKFDDYYWGEKQIPGKVFQLVSYDDSVAIKLSKKKEGFSFIVISTKKNGQIIFCSCDIISNAKESPTPLYLLKSLMIGNNTKI